MNEYDCHADERVFTDLLESLPLEVQVAIPPAGLPCSGTGIKTHMCANCPFGQEKYTPEWFDSAYEDEERLEFGSY